MEPKQQITATTASWQTLLKQAITTPGFIHEAYHRFHHYSVRNQFLAMAQCVDREIPPGPLATYKQWRLFGRRVRLGEKALVLCVPITPKKTETQQTDEELAEEEPDGKRSFFAFRARWFVLSQTDGAPYEPLSVPTWSEERALDVLGIKRVAFEHLNGNAQGYATPEGSIAISPVAALPHKTLFHETAHLLMGHVTETVPQAVREVEAEGVALLCCDALGLNGAEYSRGYLQHWLGTNELTEEMSERIIKTTYQVLLAGEQDPAPNDQATKPRASGEATA